MKQVIFSNVTIYYYEPLQTISCQNYTAKLVFGLQHQTLLSQSKFTVGEDGVSIFLNGTVRVASVVQNPVDNSTGTLLTCWLMMQQGQALPGGSFLSILYAPSRTFQALNGNACTQAPVSKVQGNKQLSLAAK